MLKEGDKFIIFENRYFEPDFLVHKGAILEIECTQQLLVTDNTYWYCKDGVKCFAVTSYTESTLIREGKLIPLTDITKILYCEG